MEGYTQTTFGANLVDPVKLDVTVGPYGNGTDSSSKINININKMYPGYAQVFQADIVNAGTIAAKLSDINVAVTDIPNNDIKSMIGVSLRVLREYAETAGESGHVDVFSTLDLPTSAYFTLGGVCFIRLSALEGLDLGNVIGAEGVDRDLLYVTPDDNRMDIYLGIAMDPDEAGAYTSGISSDLSGKSDANTENINSAKFNLTFLWDQFNVGVPSGGDHNHLE